MFWFLIHSQQHTSAPHSQEHPGLCATRETESSVNFAAEEAETWWGAEKFLSPFFFLLLYLSHKFCVPWYSLQVVARGAASRRELSLAALAAWDISSLTSSPWFDRREFSLEFSLLPNKILILQDLAMGAFQYCWGLGVFFFPSFFLNVFFWKKNWLSPQPPAKFWKIL